VSLCGWVINEFVWRLLLPVPEDTRADTDRHLVACTCPGGPRSVFRLICPASLLHGTCSRDCG
jgi:hypothetical protein